MYIKNTFRLFINNLSLGTKAMFFRLAVTILGTLAIYGILSISVSVITKSAEFGALIGDIKALWLNFIGVADGGAVDISTSFKSLLNLLNANMARIIWSLIGVLIILVIMDFLSGLCSFTLNVMVDKHMSSISKSEFMQTFVGSLKRAIPFELLLTLIKTLVFGVIGLALMGIVILTGKALSVLSVILGLWIVISLGAFFLTITTRLRPQVVGGVKIKNAFKNAFVGKKNFMSVFSAYIFAIVFLAYINVSMAIATLGAGVMLSLPMTYLFITCLQNIIEYSLEGKKFYIDFDTIIVPKEMRSEDEKLLGDVEIN